VGLRLSVRVYECIPVWGAGVEIEFKIGFKLGLGFGHAHQLRVLMRKLSHTFEVDSCTCASTKESNMKKILKYEENTNNSKYN